MSEFAKGADLVAAEAWAATMPSSTGGFDEMSPHRKRQLLVRASVVVTALREAGYIQGGKA